MREAPPPYTPSASTPATSAPSSNGDDQAILTPTESISSALPSYEASTVPGHAVTTNFTHSPSSLSPANYSPLIFPNTHTVPTSPFLSEHGTTFSSAAAYFEERQPTLQPYDEVLTHHMVITASSTPETIPFPPHAWLSRDIKYQDFATFLNYLLPHHLANPSTFADKKEQGPTKKPEVQGPIPGTEQQAIIDVVVAEWNEGFFNPRGVRIETLSPVTPPGSSDQGERAINDNAAEPSQSSSRLSSEEEPSSRRDENATECQTSWLGLGSLRQVIRFAEAARRNGEQTGQRAAQTGLAYGEAAQQRAVASGEAAQQRGMAYGRACERRAEQISRSVTSTPSTACSRRRPVAPAEGANLRTPQPSRSCSSRTQPKTYCSRWSKPCRPCNPSRPSNQSNQRRPSVSSVSSSSSSDSLSSFSSSDIPHQSATDLDDLTQHLAEIALRNPKWQQGSSRKYTKEEKHAAKQNFHTVMKQIKQKRKAEQKQHKEALKAEKHRRKEARSNEEMAISNEDYGVRYERYKLHGELYREQEELYKQWDERKRLKDQEKIARKEAKLAEKRDKMARKETMRIEKEVKQAAEMLRHWDSPLTRVI